MMKKRIHIERRMNNAIHSPTVKHSIINRLNRIEGQIRGIKVLIEKNMYCDDILNQVAAVTSALNAVGKLLLEHHLKNCIYERIQERDEQVFTELMRTMNKLIK